MKPVLIAGIILVILGIVSFGYQGLTYTTQKKVIDAGPIHVSREEQHHIPFQTVLGGLLIVGGIVLCVTGIRDATK